MMFGDSAPQQSTPCRRQGVTVSGVLTQAVLLEASAASVHQLDSCLEDEHCFPGREGMLTVCRPVVRAKARWRITPSHNLRD